MFPIKETTIFIIKQGKMGFEVELLPEASEFINNLDSKTRIKVLYNIKKSQEIQEKSLFKKITQNIWEFRTLYNRKSIRLFAFWTKKGKKEILVICTHGIIKKTSKIPVKEINKAEQIRKAYINQ